MGSARRKLQPLKVYCTEEERGRIERQAETSGMSVSEYLRRVGQGMPVQSRVDKQAVKELEGRCGIGPGWGLTQDASKERGKAAWLHRGTAEDADHGHGKGHGGHAVFSGVDFKKNFKGLA